MFRKKLIDDSPLAFKYNIVRHQDYLMNLGIAITNKKDVGICKENVYIKRDRMTSVIHTVHYTYDYLYSVCNTADSIVKGFLPHHEMVRGGIEKRLYLYHIILPENDFQGNRHHPFAKDTLRLMNEARLIHINDRLLLSVSSKDLGPYKKLIPTLHHFPHDAVITIDDDLIYDYDLLERLILPYISDPSYIYCHRMHKMRFATDGSPLPYKQWEWKSTDNQPSHLNFFTSGGGVLFPPQSLDAEVFNEEVFMKYCRTADDVWYNAMAIKKGTKVERVISRDLHGDDFLVNKYVQDVGLYHVNINGELLNDKQISVIYPKYKLLSVLNQ